jgi:UDP-N-acetylmuramoyl-L-alanyl-D-glutamate--2,6-diaminopimelate ligase
VHWAGCIATAAACAPGDGFIAWPGAATDGRQFVPTRSRRARWPAWWRQRASSAFGFERRQRRRRYPGLKAATGPIAAAYYGTRPSARRAGRHRHQRQDLHRWWLAQALSQPARAHALRA